MGLLYVISGPSGSGKTTVVNSLLKKDKTLLYSVSYTTRKPRPGEVDGKSYYFITPQEFFKKIKSGFFLEHAKVFGNYYGTPKNFILQNIKNGNILLDVDVLGAMQIKNKIRKSCLIFLYTDIEEIKKRLMKRNEQDIENRLKNIDYEMSFIKNYDYIVRNDDLDYTIDSILNIIKNNA
ncbi:MAG: guanylate kinase [bacterium]|nr:guanylate kinase [bacterium]